jgi:2'-5' RNA ligase
MPGSSIKFSTTKKIPHNMSSYTEKTYIVFLDLPAEVSAEIDKVRQKYTIKNFKKWKAHLTLKQDEDYLSGADEIGKAVAEFAGHMKPVKLELDGVKMHEIKGVGCNIFIGIKDSPALVDSIRALSRKMESMIDPDSPRAFASTKWEQSEDFYPHISLKGTADCEQGKELLARIREEKIDLPVSAVCRAITLARWREDHWEAVDTYELNF